MPNEISDNLAKNIRDLRNIRGLTQGKLARLASIPRSTVASLETGDANPTLSVLSQLAMSLQASIEELISAPRAVFHLFKKGDLPIKGEGKKITINKLLPDPIPGMEIDRIELQPDSRLKGVPHRSGTKEYLFCESGEITLYVGGEKLCLEKGDVAAFT